MEAVPDSLQFETSGETFSLQRHVKLHLHFKQGMYGSLVWDGVHMATAIYSAAPPAC